MSSFTKVLSITSQIIVICVGLLVIGLVGRAYLPHSNIPPELRQGNAIPLAVDITRSAHAPALLVFMRKGCHFCEESLPFYARLEQSRSISQRAVAFIAVFPDGREDAAQILRTANLNIPFRSEANLGSYGVRGTPTLVLTDRKGRIKHTWLGKLDTSGEQSVIEALNKNS